MKKSATKKISYFVTFIILMSITIFSFTITSDANAEKPNKDQITKELNHNFKIEKHWVRPTFGDNASTAAYMSITNLTNEDDFIVNLQCKDAYKVEFHKIVTVDGISRMVPISKLAIPAKKTVHLKPTKMHVMIMGIQNQLKIGDNVNIEITFENSGKMSLTIPVKNK